MKFIYIKKDDKNTWILSETCEDNMRINAKQKKTVAFILKYQTTEDNPVNKMIEDLLKEGQISFEKLNNSINNNSHETFSKMMCTFKEKEFGISKDDTIEEIEDTKFELIGNYLHWYIWKNEEKVVYELDCDKSYITKELAWVFRSKNKENEVFWEDQDYKRLCEDSVVGIPN